MILKKPQEKEIDFSHLYKVKSENSIKLINKLHNSLNILEEKCSQSVANKYLNGFLEEKGVNSYKEFIDSLI